MTQLKRHSPDSTELPAILTLIRDSFAYMDNIIDPPSSVHKMTLNNLRKTAKTAEVWSLGLPTVGCMILTPKTDILYIGKLAVCASQRGQGLSRQLIEHASKRAESLGLECLELCTRIELTSNHRTFENLGFVEFSKDCHPGFVKHTQITYRRVVSSHS